MVRRPTGGGAILHAQELTYALVLPAGTGPQIEDASALYRRMHGVIASALHLLGAPAAALGQEPAPGPSRPSARRGEFWCFGRAGRYDLNVGSRKVAGSAQRRRRGGVLQHGSVILARTFPFQPGGSVEEALGRRVGFEELASALVEVLRRGGMVLRCGGLEACERAALPQLQARHASPEWLARR